MTPEQRLADRGHPLPPEPAPSSKPYLPLVQIGQIVYGSGNTSMDRSNGHVYGGHVGDEVSLDDAREYARIAVLNALTALKVHLGELDRVDRLVRVTGYVNSAPTFTQQADVINAASELLLEAFGEKGRHARSAIGVAQLPGGAAVEIEIIAMVR